MTTWTTTDLANLIVRIESGGRPQGGASEDSGEIPSLGGENIRQLGGLALESVKKVPLVFFRRMTKGVLRDQDVLINKDGANTGKVGLYESQYPEASINEHVFLLRGKPGELDQRFLYYLLLSPSGQEIIRAKISGSAQPGLKRGFVQDFAVTVPVSIAEQHKIAAVLSALDCAIEQTEALIAKYRRIKTGLMHDLLTRGIDEHGNLRDPATHRFKPSPVGLVPEEWEVEPFGRHVDSSAFGPRFSSALYSESGGVAMLRTTDLDTEGNIITQSLPRAALDPYEYRNHLLKAGDLLITRSGTIGVTTVFQSYELPVIPSAFTIRFRLQDSASPAFFRYFFNSYSGRTLLLRNAAGGVQKNLTGTSILALTVPVPGPEEQKAIGSIIQLQNRLESETRANLDVLRRVKTGLMQDLLTGKVSVAPLLMV